MSVLINIVVYLIGLFVAGFLGAWIQGDAKYGIIPAGLAAIWTAICIGYWVSRLAHG